MRWKTILVPHDFSPGAERALDLACELASRLDARLVLGHVTTLPAGLDADAMVKDPDTARLVPAEDLARASARRKLAETGERLHASGVKVETRVAIAEVVPGILALADECDADLIAMGTHGRSGLEHLLLGSVAEKVIRKSPIPVLTARAEGASTPTQAEQQLADEQDG